MKFQSIPVRLVKNQDYPSKTKLNPSDHHPELDSEGNEQKTTHFRRLAFAEFDDDSLTPDLLYLTLYNDQADRFDYPVGTVGIVLVDLVNKTSRDGKDYIDVRIKNFVPQTL